MNETTKPKMLKMLLIAWIYAFIVINMVFALIGRYILDLHPVIRSMILTTLLVPAMGLGIPAVQKKFYKWTIK